MQSSNAWFVPLHESQGALRVAGVCKAYRRLPALFPTSFSLEGGHALALLGPNGSGKSTLLRLVAGLTRPTQGEIDVCGHSLGDGARSIRAHVGLIGHDSYLYDDLTGRENLRFFVSLAGGSIDDIRIAESLDTVGMRMVADGRVGTYSTGMKRRIGLARLLLLQPEVLLLDEPHASLDSRGQELVDTLVMEARSSGRIVVVASHDPARVLRLCDRVMVLDSGRAVFHGEACDWAERPPMWIVERHAQ